MFRPTTAAILLCFTLNLSAAPKAQKPAAKPPRDPVARELHQLATRQLGALQRGELEVVADFAHPNVLTLVGGRQGAISMVRGKLDDLKAEGGRLEKIHVSEPSQIVREKTRTFALVPMEIVVLMPEERITQRSCLLGIRDDPEPGSPAAEAPGWKFLDVGVMGDLMIKLVMPKLPEGLKIPAREEPVHEKLPAPSPAAPDVAPKGKKG